MSTELPSAFLTTHFSTTNSSYHHVTASETGSTHLQATLSHLRNPVSKELHTLPTPVSRKQLLEIYDPIGVEPRQLVLLWDPQSGFRYKHILRVSWYWGGFLVGATKGVLGVLGAVHWVLVLLLGCHEAMGSLVRSQVLMLEGPRC